MQTVWLPLALDSQFCFIKPVPCRLKFVSCSVAESLQVCDDICPHLTLIESLDAGREMKLCAISVVLMAMLFSTPDFNALQILIESGRFDLRELSVFNQFDLPSWKWVLIAVHELGITLLIDIVNYKYNKAATDAFFIVAIALRFTTYVVMFQLSALFLKCSAELV